MSLVGVACAALGYLAGSRAGAPTEEPASPTSRPEPRRLPDAERATPDEPGMEPSLGDPRPPPAPAPAASAAAPLPPRLEVERSGPDTLVRVPEGALKVVLVDGEYVLRRHGPWATRHENGAVATQGEYRDGIPIGTWRTYHADGALEAVAPYEDGALHGLFERRHPGGARAEETPYERGTRHGRARRWHPNGALAEEGEWRAGKWEGRWVAWDEEGRVLHEAEWKDGALTGPIRILDPGGRYRPEAELREKAAIGGKYRTLLRTIAAPDDKATYGEFRDYAWHGTTGYAYAGHRDVPFGYWVYAFPYWFVWGESTQAKKDGGR
jgi:antitoxin component YwqK of YwqJK toxin-antitoxin module